MAYEHKAEVDQVVEAILSIAEAVGDDIPDVQQLAQILMAATAAVAATSAALSAEEQRKYKLKFAAKVGTALSNTVLDEFLPDSES